MAQILPPIRLGLCDVLSLAAFVAAGEQDNDIVCIFPEIDPITSSKKQPQIV